MVLRGTVKVGIEPVVLRLEPIEVEAQRRIERQRAVEQAELVAKEHAAQHVVGLRKRAARKDFSGRWLDAVADALLVGPAHVAAQRDAMGQSAGGEAAARFGRKPPDAVFEGVEPRSEEHTSEL